MHIWGTQDATRAPGPSGRHEGQDSACHTSAWQPCHVMASWAAKSPWPVILQRRQGVHGPVHSVLRHYVAEHPHTAASAMHKRPCISVQASAAMHQRPCISGHASAARDRCCPLARCTRMLSTGCCLKQQPVKPHVARSDMRTQPRVPWRAREASCGAAGAHVQSTCIPGRTCLLCAPQVQAVGPPSAGCKPHTPAPASAAQGRTAACGLARGSGGLRQHAHVQHACMDAPSSF
jgi:hypothetical protein